MHNQKLTFSYEEEHKKTEEQSDLLNINIYTHTHTYSIYRIDCTCVRERDRGERDLTRKTQKCISTLQKRYNLLGENLTDLKQSIK